MAIQNELWPEHKQTVGWGEGKVGGINSILFIDSGKLFDSIFMTTIVVYFAAPLSKGNY